LGSGVAQPALPQLFGSGVAVVSMAQLPVSHKFSALPGSGTRISLAAIAQNLRRLAKLVARPPPAIEGCVA